MNKYMNKASRETIYNNDIEKEIKTERQTGSEESSEEGR